MKRTPLKRKTPLRASRKPLQRSIRPATRRKAPTITKLKKKLWTLCREITRKRYGNSCYTCGKTGLEGGNWQTSHFIPSSICTVELRYSLNNLRPACYHCNINLSGNWPAYEERLDAENGRGFAESLKAQNRRLQGAKYGSEWYEAKIIEYQAIYDSMATDTRA